MASDSRAIHVWVPGIREGSGGIQAFSRAFVQILRESHPDKTIRVFVKNDRPGPDDPLRKMGIVFHSVSGFFPVLRTPALALIGLLQGFLEKPCCTIATHLHFLPALRHLRWLRGIPFGGVLHGIEAWNLKKRGRIAALRAADHLIAVSHHTRAAVIRSYGVGPGRVTVVPNSFDPGRFEPGPKPAHLLERHGLRPDQPVLLTVSRLALSERYKGHRQVLTAMIPLIKEFPDIRYVVVGEGDDRERLQEAASALGLQDNVTLAGQIPGAELPDYYRLCDAFVMPSTKEGFGIVFLEAMASGKPVVAGDSDGSVDALDQGRLGVLVDPNNPREIAAAIARVLRRDHPHRLLFDPPALSKAAVALFGFERIKGLLAADLAHLITGQPQRATPPEEVSSPPARNRAPVITVLTQLTSPYQVEFFNAISAFGRCNLEVIYLTNKDRNRQWGIRGIAHNHVILSETPTLAGNVMEAIEGSDLVVFNYYIHPFALRAIRARARTGRPLVFWGERPGFLRLGALGTWFRRLALRPLHQSRAPIWGVGDFGIEGYRREFGDQRRYWNLPYFSNLARFRRGQRPEKPAGQRVFLFSSVLGHRKGADLVARAFARVAAGRPHLRLIVMGEGDLEPLMRSLLSEVATQVSWTGFRQWSDLPGWFLKADILCAPSRHDGWGLAIIQGLAAGLPVISTDQAGATLQFVRDGHNGWVCPANDLNAVIRAMEAAADLPPAALAAMADAAEASVEDHALDHGAVLFHEAATEAIESWPTPASAGKPIA